MPAPSEILRSLSNIANGAVPISIAWHAALIVAAAALLFGLRPQKRAAALILSAPLLSVALLAFAFGNPFNGATFSLLAVVLAVLARPALPGAITFRSDWSAYLGALLIGFGVVYPHFLDASWLTYLYAAPFGAIPCPTLSVVVGSALLVGSFDLRAWRVVLALAGCFYAVFGALRLGVFIDVVLLVGSLGLLLQNRRLHGPRLSRPKGRVGGFSSVESGIGTAMIGAASRADQAFERGAFRFDPA
ncbi:MAG TPA: hypothetical protein VHP33_18695 [Polyangiaceae bacterium]|nr:hypothetical protein [Polyangiaceae bacterium]